MQPTTQDKSSSSISSKEKKDWIDLINESVHTSDDIDIGDIDGISRNFIVVKRGFVNIHYYYIPVKKVEGWDGDVLWLKVTEKKVKEKYERDRIPDPRQYVMKEQRYRTIGYSYPSPLIAYYPLPLIARRYSDPYQNYQNIEESTPEKDVPRVYKCELCEEVFNSEDELDKHMDIARH